LEFGTLLSDPAKRRRVVSAFVAVILIAIVCAAVGLSMDIAPLTVFAAVLLAGCLAAIGKLLITVAVHLHGAAGRLKDLNDRYDETERWLEQFDRGTRSTFVNLNKSQGELRSKTKEIHARLSDVRQDIERFATREALGASMKSVTTESAKLLESVGKVAEQIDQAAGEAKEMSRSIREVRESGEIIEASVDAVKNELQKQSQELENSIEIVSNDLQAKSKQLESSMADGFGEQEKIRQVTLRSVQEETKEQIESVGTRVDKDLTAIRRTVDTSAALASRLRGDGYVQFARLVSSEFVEKINGDIGNKLNVSIEPSQVRYLERKIQQIEAVCEGRLATTSEDAVARVLAARSCKADQLKILEIGVLFGIGAAIMHTSLVPFYKRVELFLLDPFDGYYGTENLDPLTGQTVTRSAVERNMKRAAIDPADVHIFEGFSTDDAILKKIRTAGPFDVIVIDGDHSYDGVRADYERYSDLLVDGGILIVDDYGSEDWPEVTRYVDDVLMKDDRFDHIGVLSRTTIFRRNQNGKEVAKKVVANTKRQETQETSLPVAKETQASSSLSNKIAKKVAAKKASKKTSKKTSSKKISKANPTKKKAQPAKKPVKPLAEEIAGKQKSVAGRAR